MYNRKTYKANAAPVSSESSGGGDADESSHYSAKATDEWGEEFEPEPKHWLRSFLIQTHLNIISVAIMNDKVKKNQR